MKWDDCLLVRVPFELPVQIPVQLLLELEANWLDQNVNKLEFELKQPIVFWTTSAVLVAIFCYVVTFTINVCHTCFPFRKYFLKKLQFRSIYLPYRKCVTAYVNKGCNLLNPSFLTVLLWIPFDKLPCTSPTLWMGSQSVQTSFSYHRCLHWNDVELCLLGPSVWQIWKVRISEFLVMLVSKS